MRLTRMAFIALIGVSIVGTALAQPAPPAQPSSAPGMGPGSGMGPGMAQGGKAAHFGWNKGNTTGWSLMTTEERTAHQAKMHAVTNYDDCKALQEVNHNSMEMRAKEKGVKLTRPRQNGCDVMKARGFIK